MSKISLKDLVFNKTTEKTSSSSSKLEDSITQGLKDFLENNKSENLDSFIPQIKKALEVHFSHIEDSNKLVYRGLRLSLEEFKKIFWNVLTKEQKELYYKIEDGLVLDTDYSVIKNFVLKPKNAKYIQSWTSNKKTALSFSVGGEINVLCIAKHASPNLFFGKPGELAKIISSKFDNEQETISIGPVKCTKIIFGPSGINKSLNKY